MEEYNKLLFKICDNGIFEKKEFFEEKIIGNFDKTFIEFLKDCEDMISYKWYEQNYEAGNNID